MPLTLCAGESLDVPIVAVPGCTSSRVGSCVRVGSLFGGLCFRVFSVFSLIRFYAIGAHLLFRGEHAVLPLYSSRLMHIEFLRAPP